MDAPSGLRPDRRRGVGQELRDATVASTPEHHDGALAHEVVRVVLEPRHGSRSAHPIQGADGRRPQPGVTRTLRWVRLGQDLDLLDAPGVLPPRLDNQQAALHLALCDDIGQAAYDGELVAQAFLNLLKGLQPQAASGVVLALLESRYGIPLEGATEDPAYWLEAVAERHTSGDTARMAQRLLDDFRKSALGSIALELPA